MPGYDRTGPTGSGPMSGGRRGFCSSQGNRSGFADEPKEQRGRMGWRRGSRSERSRGFGRFDSSRMPPVPVEAENNHELLETEVSELRKVVEALQQRLDNLT